MSFSKMGTGALEGFPLQQGRLCIAPQSEQDGRQITLCRQRFRMVDAHRRSKAFQGLVQCPSGSVEIADPPQSESKLVSYPERFKMIGPVETRIRIEILQQGDNAFGTRHFAACRAGRSSETRNSCNSANEWEADHRQKRAPNVRRIGRTALRRAAFHASCRLAP